MSAIVYRISCLLEQILDSVPIGTNLGLFSLLFALLSGRLLASHGAVFPALADLGLDPPPFGGLPLQLVMAAWRARICSRLGSNR